VHQEKQEKAVRIPPTKIPITNHLSQPVGAINAHRDNLADQKRLAAADRSNTPSQRDLAVVHSKLAAVLAKRGDTAQALAELRKARDIMASLVAVSPDHAQFKDDLTEFDGAIARLEDLARP
jgi:hypothetical protein